MIISRSQRATDSFASLRMTSSKSFRMRSHIGVRSTGGSFAFRSSLLRDGRSRVLISFQRASWPASALGPRRRRRHRGGGLRVRVLDDLEKGFERFVHSREVLPRPARGPKPNPPALPSRAAAFVSSAAIAFAAAARRVLLERFELRAERRTSWSAVKSSRIAAQIRVASSNCRARSAAEVLTRGSISTVSGCVEVVAAGREPDHVLPRQDPRPQRDGAACRG